MTKSLYVRMGKRCFDTIVAGFGVLVLSPFLVLVAIAVKLSSPGPVFFRQTRVGQFGRPFQMFKFRSMKASGQPGSRLTAIGDSRVTPLGAWLRRTKIDELPQLLNVVLGDMSLVGPRPEVPEFTVFYTKKQNRILECRPGITGPSINIYEEELLAEQVDKEKFYIAAILPAKLKIDLSYCQNIAFKTDLYILYQTFAKLLIRIYGAEKRMSHPSSQTICEISASKK